MPTNSKIFTCFIVLMLVSSNFPFFLPYFNASNNESPGAEIEEESIISDNQFVIENSQANEENVIDKPSRIVRWDEVFTKNFYQNDALIKIRNDNAVEFIVTRANSEYSPETIAIFSKYNIEINEELPSFNASIVYIPIELIQGSFEALLNTVISTPEIEHMEPNFYFELDLVPNDQYYVSEQWDLPLIGMETAWDEQLGSHNIVVAVLDTGIDYNHPDLSANYNFTLGYDWVNDDSDPMDDNGHGTHCAGTIAAAINNAIGIAGMANVSIFAEKCFSEDGLGYSGDIATAIVNATDEGADILSCSFSGPYSETMRAAIDYATSKGVMVIAAAGNYNSDTPRYPAAYSGVIAVSAINESDFRASFSNYGEWVDVSAPGVNIFSTYLYNQYETLSGTSMACPHVSGLAALLMSQYPSYTAEQIEILIYASAVDLGTPGYDIYYGNGRINTSNVFKEVPTDLSVSLDVPASPEIDNTYVINATVKNNFHEESNVDFFLYLNGNLINSTNIVTLPEGESKILNYLWTPTQQGNFNFTAYAPPVNNENYTRNNKITEFEFITSNYTMFINSSYYWIDASDGTELYLDDDGYSTQTLPFTFSFYNTEFSTVYLGANGYLSFTDSTPDDFYNVPFPSDDYEHSYLIAPFWTDIQTRYGGGEGRIYVKACDEYWVAEWKNIYHYFEDEIGTFEVILYKNGDIVFNYGYISYTWSDYTCGLNLGIDTRYYNSYQNLNDSIDDFSICFTNRSNNFKPDLTMDSVSPPEGFVGLINQTTQLNFSVIYEDGDNNPPIYINVLINGTAHAMEKQDPSDMNYTDGCLYQYLTYLQPGNYNHSFECADCRFINYTKVKIDLTVAEKPNENAPTLNDGEVTPSTGYVDLTVFTFKVNYSDADNNAPLNVSVTINLMLYYMTKQDTEDMNYMDGCLYIYKIVFGKTGNYSFYFNCSDGKNNAGNGPFEGPKVKWTLLHDGMNINRLYTMGSASSTSSISSLFEYFYVSGVTFRVFWYRGYFGSILFLMGKWDVNIETREMTNALGGFGNNAHSPIWIFTNLSLGNKVLIAVDDEGDHEFEVAGEQQYSQYGYDDFNVWVLEDLDQSGGIAYYDKNTGILIQGAFYYSGGSYYYSFELPVIEDTSEGGGEESSSKKSSNETAITSTIPDDTLMIALIIVSSSIVVAATGIGIIAIFIRSKKKIF